MGAQRGTANPIVLAVSTSSPGCHFQRRARSLLKNGTVNLSKIRAFDLQDVGVGPIVSLNILLSTRIRYAQVDNTFRTTRLK
jgi:hypothetical protein